MSMSTHVIGFRPPDEKWKKMKAVWEACRKADVKVPEDVLDFFNHVAPDDRGVEVVLEKLPSCTKKFKAEAQDGFEIDVTKLPAGVTVVRFYNAY